MTLPLTVAVAVFFIGVVLFVSIKAERVNPLPPSDIHAAYDVNLSFGLAILAKA
jgi:hypothetical protein